MKIRYILLVGWCLSVFLYTMSKADNVAMQQCQVKYSYDTCFKMLLN